MSQSGPLRQQLIDRFDEMSPQLQQAARYLIENPQEIALNSMRELARNANVQPATMTRLAKFLGVAGYEDLRIEQAGLIRRGNDGFVHRAMESERHHPADSPANQAKEMLIGLSAQIAKLTKPESLQPLTAAAEAMAKARRIYVQGARSCHSVAWQFHYVMSLLGEKTCHLDGPGGTGPDPLIWATTQDALLVISVNPYSKQSLDIAKLARDRGVMVIAITDSAVSPLVGIANHTVLCPVESATFFHSLTPALAVSEVLCGLLANANRAEALAALAKTDAQQRALETYSATIPKRKIS